MFSLGKMMGASASRNGANDALFYSYVISPESLGHVKKGKQIFVRTEPCIQTPKPSAKTFIETTRSDECREMDFGGSFSLEGTYGMFSGSANLKASKSSKRRNHVVCSEYKIVMTRYELVPGESLSVAPEEQLLPEIRRKLEKGKIKMKELERLFGDFYSEQCMLGGAFLNKTVMEIEENESSSSIEAQLNASYGSAFAKVKTSVGLSVASRESNENASVSSKIQVEGGNTAVWLGLTSGVPDVDKVQREWASTTSDSNLIAMQHEFRPSWELIERVNESLGAKYKEYTEERWAKSQEKTKNLLAKYGYVPKSKKNIKIAGEGKINVHETRADDVGGGSAFYLDRHHVKVPKGEILTGFKLIRPTRGTIAYEFSGRVTSNLSKETNSATSYEQEGGGNSIFLDRQCCMAPEGCFLTGFKLFRNGRGTMRYDYSYVQASMGRTEEKSTRPNDWGQGKVHYLDRHDIQVPAGCGLRGFQLYRPTRSTIAYTYWYAPIKA